MERERVSGEVTAAAFEFFFWFSRFESALKENGYLKSNAVGANATPDWNAFVRKWDSEYLGSGEAQKLVALQPKTQIVAQGARLDWKATSPEAGSTELRTVVLMLRTIRNNLFHGGKHGADTWDNAERTLELLCAATPVLAELARLGRFEGDYLCFY